MFSSLDEAWSQPKFKSNISSSRAIIEPFESNNNCDCEELIKKITNCPSCMDQLKLTIVQNSHFSTVQKIYRKYLMYLTPQMKENIITILLILASLILIMIILEK